MTTKAYDDMVERIRAERFKPTKMTEAETQAEIEHIQDGAKSSFGIADGQEGTFTVHTPTIGQPKKRRGRPPGSKNKPKLAD